MNSAKKPVILIILALVTGVGILLYTHLHATQTDEHIPDTPPAAAPAVAAHDADGPMPIEGRDMASAGAPAVIDDYRERFELTDDDLDPDVEPVIPGVTAPPDMFRDGSIFIASPMDDGIWLRADEIMIETGPEGEAHAWGLLDQDPQMALVGTAILLNEPDWSEAVMERIANQHPSVSLFAMQGLRDQGRWEESDQIARGARERLGSVTDWDAFLGEVALPGTSVRGLVELSREWAEEERRIAMMDSVLGHAEIDYSGRMRTLLEFEDLGDFVSYRERVYEELGRAGVDRFDPIWNLGVERLAERLEGPVEVHMQPRIVTSVDVDLLTAREHSAMFEDLALYLEQSLRREDAMFERGLADQLAELVQQQFSLPLYPSEQEALRRIAVISETLPEDDLSEFGNLFPPFD